MVKWFTDIKGIVYLRLFFVGLSKTGLVNVNFHLSCTWHMIWAQMVSGLFA